MHDGEDLYWNVSNFYHQLKLIDHDQLFYSGWIPESHSSETYFLNLVGCLRPFLANKSVKVEIWFEIIKKHCFFHFFVKIKYPLAERFCHNSHFLARQTTTVLTVTGALFIELIFFQVHSYHYLSMGWF